MMNQPIGPMKIVLAEYIVACPAEPPSVFVAASSTFACALSCIRITGFVAYSYVFANRPINPVTRKAIAYCRIFLKLFGLMIILLFEIPYVGIFLPFSDHQNDFFSISPDLISFLTL